MINAVRSLCAPAAAGGCWRSISARGRRSTAGSGNWRGDSCFRPFNDKAEFRGVWLEPNGFARMQNKVGRPYNVGVDPQAIGGAWEMALGAMYAGASAEEAVRLCIERRAAAGDEAFVERLGT